MKLPFLITYGLILTGIFSVLTVGQIEGEDSMQSINEKKVVCIIAHNNFRDEELLEPKKILEKNGVDVTIASSSLKEAKGMLGAEVKPEMLFSDINVSDYDAVLFIGGSGASEYWDNSTAHAIAQKAYKANKIIGAICIAPVTLAKAGLLENRKATTYSSTVNEIKAAGAEYTGADVERDGNIITASGPDVAGKFGETILIALRN